MFSRAFTSRPLTLVAPVCGRIHAPSKRRLAMRIALDIAIFAGVFMFALALFQSPVHAVLAGLIISGAGDTLVWSEPKKR